MTEPGETRTDALKSEIERLRAANASLLESLQNSSYSGEPRTRSLNEDLISAERSLESNAETAEASSATQQAEEMSIYPARSVRENVERLAGSACELAILASTTRCSGTFSAPSSHLRGTAFDPCSLGEGTSLKLQNDEQKVAALQEPSVRHFGSAHENWLRQSLLINTGPILSLIHI